jgi:hypothetical protein
MTVPTRFIKNHFGRPSAAGQILLTTFVAIPLTLGLVVALAGYCAFEYLAFTLFPKPQTLGLTHASLNGHEPASSVPANEQKFSASIANLAQVHGPTPIIESAPFSHDGQAVQQDAVQHENR